MNTRQLVGDTLMSISGFLLVIAANLNDSVAGSPRSIALAGAGLALVVGRAIKNAGDSMPT